MSSKPAAMPIFGDAYLADTGHLSTEEHGAYFLLLIAAWRADDCALPDDDRKLARIAKVSPYKWRAIRHTIMEFWTLQDGRWFQKRQREVRAFVEARSQQAREAASASWARRRGEDFSPDDAKNFEGETAKKPAPRRRKQSVENKRSQQSERISGEPCGSHASQTQTQEIEEEEEEGAREFEISDATMARIVAAWNAMADVSGLTPVSRLSANQSAKLRERLREYGAAAILQAIATIPGTPFLMGRGPNGWHTNFSHLVRPDRVRKILDGEYFTKSGDGLQNALNDPSPILDDPFGTNGKGW